MNTRLLIAFTLVLSLAVPVGLATAKTNDPATVTAAAKKKKQTWCQKKVKEQTRSDKKSYKRTVTYKRVGAVKSAKFSLYARKFKGKRADQYFICSESPKFTTNVSAWSGIVRTSHVRAVGKNCAIFFTETKKGSYWSDGAKEINIIDYKYFRKNSKYPPQTSSTTLGNKDAKVKVERIKLSKNCVMAASYTVDGAPKLQIAGLGDFPYQGFRTIDLPGATAAELRSLNVKIDAKNSVLVTYKKNGVTQKVQYPGS